MIDRRISLATIASHAARKYRDVSDSKRLIEDTVVEEVAAIIKTGDPERAAEILTEVAQSGPVTARSIRDAAAALKD